MQNEFGLEGNVAVSDLVRFPGALERTETQATIPGEASRTLLGLVSEALQGLDTMRRAEGERLQAELERALQAIERAAPKRKKPLGRNLKRKRKVFSPKP